MSQLDLLKAMRMTETFEPLDTLTVSAQLVADSDRFFDLCEACVGSNVMRGPISFKRQELRYLASNPTWFSPDKPHSMAEWLLYFIERAIWLQFKAVVEQSESKKVANAQSNQTDEGMD